MTAVGVDWASGCWVVVVHEGDDATITTEPAMLNVWREHGRGADAVLVDVPIGLPETAPRACDRAAGSLLGERHSSVFDVPCRAAVDADGYEAARAENGGRLGSQSWGLVPRIREVGCFLDDHPAAEASVYESHPEVCYAAFAARTDADDPGSKRETEGQDARLAILDAVDAAFGAAVRAFVEDRRTDSQWHQRIQSGRLDDVLDAAVLALTAREGSFGVLPAGRDADDRQVIVYPDGGA
jgi:predicted RNase H-like nuclease